MAKAKLIPNKHIPKELEKESDKEKYVSINKKRLNRKIIKG